MNRKLIVGILILGLFACEKKSVKLPLLGVTGIQETIYDNTKIWMFYNDVPEPSLVLNTNNKISGTNWIFNIDKRLTMGMVVPELSKELAKRNKPSKADDPKAITNYFSYVDSVNNALSLVRFDSINFQVISPAALKPSIGKNIFDLRIRQSQITINDSICQLSDLNKYFMPRSEGDIAIRLSYANEISYGRYLLIKASLSNLLNDNEKIRVMIDEKVLKD